MVDLIGFKKQQELEHRPALKGIKARTCKQDNKLVIHDKNHTQAMLLSAIQTLGETMHTLILDHRNIRLEYDNKCLIIRQDDTKPRSIPLQHLSKIVCLHNVDLTTSLLGQLWKRGIDFVTLNSRHADCSFGLYANQQQQVERRCRQYAWQQHESTALALARTLCEHRIRLNLRLLKTDTPSPLLQQQLEQALTRIPEATNLASLRGLEGAAQRLMFAHWRTQLPVSLGFERRQRRPPKDPVNSLLSLTSSLLLQDAVRECTAAGLDPYLGFYHRTVSGRHSLACDLLETLRPKLEQWVMQLFINKQFDRRYFTGLEQPDSPCFLGKAGRELYYPLLQKMLPTWQRQLRATARWLCQHIDQSQEVLTA